MSDASIFTSLMGTRNGMKLALGLHYEQLFHDQTITRREERQVGKRHSDRKRHGEPTLIEKGMD